MMEITAGRGIGPTAPPPPTLPVSFEGTEAVAAEPEPQIPREVLDAPRREVEARNAASAAKNEARAVQQDEEDKTRARARARQENINRFKPLLFIVATLGAWWLIIMLANAAVTCVPGGYKCGVDGPFSPTTQMSNFKWVFTLISAGAALWVSKMMVYPSREFPNQ
jgi:hypothetical protein